MLGTSCDIGPAQPVAIALLTTELNMQFPSLAILTLMIASPLAASARAQESNPCRNSQVSFETRTLEKIVRQPELVIEEGGSFWENEKPLEYTKIWRMRSMSGYLT